MLSCVNMEHRILPHSCPLSCKGVRKASFSKWLILVKSDKYSTTGTAWRKKAPGYKGPQTQQHIKNSSPHSGTWICYDSRRNWAQRGCPHSTQGGEWQNIPRGPDLRPLPPGATSVLTALTSHPEDTGNRVALALIFTIKPEEDVIHIYKDKGCLYFEI